MKFSKAIQIKQWVNRFNQDRSEFNSGSIKFECSMFSDGEWRVDLKPIGVRMFFSCEMDRLITLYAGGGFTMIIGSVTNAPYIDMQ